MDTYDYDAKQDALAARYEAAGRKLRENLAFFDGKVGSFLWHDGETTFSFVAGNVSVDFGGFDTHPTFEVEIDDFRTEVQYDVTQMQRFEDEIDLFEHLAEDPGYWCFNAVGIAKSIREAEAEEAA